MLLSLSPSFLLSVPCSLFLVPWHPTPCLPCSLCLPLWPGGVPPRARVRHLDAVVITHSHADAIGGAVSGSWVRGVRLRVQGLGLKVSIDYPWIYGCCTSSLSQMSFERAWEKEGISNHGDNAPLESWGIAASMRRQNPPTPSLGICVWAPASCFPWLRSGLLKRLD